MVNRYDVYIRLVTGDTRRFSTSISRSDGHEQNEAISYVWCPLITTRTKPPRTYNMYVYCYNIVWQVAAS